MLPDKERASDDACVGAGKPLGRRRWRADEEDDDVPSAPARPPPPPALLSRGVLLLRLFLLLLLPCLTERAGGDIGECASVMWSDCPSCEAGAAVANTPSMAENTTPIMPWANKRAVERQASTAHTGSASVARTPDRTRTYRCAASLMQHEEKLDELRTSDTPRLWRVGEAMRQLWM